MGKVRSKKVLVIGWDAADWKVIEPLMQEGKMPALKRLMESGVYGRIQTLDPPLSPMLWTSIATGFRADIHGIGGFVEPLPDGSGLRPVTSTSRKVKAIWNILNQEGRKSNVVAWWPSNPAEPINGVMVSNMYQVATKPIGEEWPMPAGTIFPKEMESELAEFRVHPLELTPRMVAPFIPNIAENKELRKEKRTFSVMKVLANAASVHGASTHLMENTDWDFMALYHDAIDHFSHLAMKYHPPRRNFIPEEDFENYKGVVEAGYRFHDMMLDRTLDLIDDQTTVILVSDHGFHSDHQRPVVIPKEPSGPAYEHSPYGVIVMSGPGIKKGGVEISGSSVLDITPTILALYGLPVGKDMEGKVLYQAFEDNTIVDFIDSWEKVAGNHGMHPNDQQEDPWAAQEALQQLVDLGYIDPIEENVAEQVAKARAESEYYVARNMIQAGRIQPALEILQRIFDEHKIARHGQRLANVFLTLGRYLECEKLIKELRVIEKEEIKKNREEYKELLKKEGKELEKDTEIRWAENIEEPMYLDYMQGLLYLAMNKPWLALPVLDKVAKKNQTNAEVPNTIGKILLQRKKYKMAEKHFIRSLAIDDRNARTHYNLGISYLRRNKLDLALEEILQAIQLNFYVPNFHYHLGEVLARMNDYQNAAQAFEVAIRFVPGMARAHQWLHEIYSEKLNEYTKAEEHKKFIEKNIKGELIVVTGLPGSGADKLIKSLEAGGVDVLFGTDSKEDINSENELQYLSELNQLANDSNYKIQAKGKAIKLFIQQLGSLPDDFDYRLIHVKRDVKEIYSTHEKFEKVSRKGVRLDLLSRLEYRLNLVKEVVDSRPNFQMIEIEAQDLFKHKEDCFSIISEFIKKDLDTNLMTKTLNDN
jgi:predicted AlkP superfamily phosphohydrolase/phosphomutase/tetratricopeptide (TPR) repeat protein